MGLGGLEEEEGGLGGGGLYIEYHRMKTTIKEGLSNSKLFISAEVVLFLVINMMML